MFFIAPRSDEISSSFVVPSIKVEVDNFFYSAFTSDIVLFMTLQQLHGNIEVPIQYIFAQTQAVEIQMKTKKRLLTCKTRRNIH